MQPKDPYEAAADEVIDEITSRKGLRHEYDNIDDDVQREIRAAFVEIMKLNFPGH